MLFLTVFWICLTFSYNLLACVHVPFSDGAFDRVAYGHNHACFAGIKVRGQMSNRTRTFTVQPIHRVACVAALKNLIKTCALYMSVVTSRTAVRNCLTVPLPRHYTCAYINTLESICIYACLCRPCVLPRAGPISNLYFYYAIIYI